MTDHRAEAERLLEVSAQAHDGTFSTAAATSAQVHATLQLGEQIAALTLAVTGIAQYMVKDARTFEAMTSDEQIVEALEIAKRGAGLA